MGTEHKVLGYVVEMRTWRKHGNGAKGGGRQGSSGKKAALYKTDAAGKRELVDSAEGSSAKDAQKNLRKKTGLIPQHVSINSHGETRF